MAEGRFDQAVLVYGQMVKAIPGNPGLLLNLGLAEELGGHPDRAIPHFQAVLKAQPSNVPALTSLAMSHLQMNQPAEAVVPLRKVVALNGRDVNARGMLAGAELSLSHLENAAQQYRQLTALTQAEPKAWYGLGKSYEGLAGQSFDRLAKLDQQSAYVALLLADSRLQQQQFRSAFFFYREAEKKAPDLPGLHSGLAQVYNKTGHADWAKAEAAREIDPCQAPATPACLFVQGKFLNAAAGSTASPAALFWKARAYNALAAQSFDKLSQLPESVELHAIKAQVLHDHKQDLQASKEWSAALALSPDPNDPKLRSELATSLFLANDFASAIPALQSLLATDPESPDLNFMLGESLWRSQQAEQALPYLQHALRQAPDMLSAHAALGLALASLGKNAEAIPHLEQAQTLDDDGSLHYSLGRAYQAAGNAEKAKAAMTAYTGIQRKNAEVNGAIATESEISAPGPGKP